jgi:hypothetical protein
MLKPVSPTQSQNLRDDIEQDLHDHVSAQLRGWLTDVRTAALTAVNSPQPNVLLAAAGDEMPGMGTIAQWWAQRVDEVLVQAVRASLYRSFNRWSDMSIDASPAMSATNQYLANVRDRLVLGTHFGVPVYEEAFDKIRLSLATSAAEGWTRPQLAARIAAELGWEEDGPYWRGVKADVDFQIDNILDPLGPPGTPAREAARLNDPQVLHLREQRNLAISHLDAERSVWQTRANLIARTESTGGANFGAHQALISEGVQTKVWVATGDTRTRPSHRDADSQERGIARRFRVGTALLQFPGDPAGPVHEIAACRCTIVGGP